MFSPGDKIKQYEILRLLGKGGMGEVYLAHDAILDRKVALKFLPDELESDPQIKDRFLREAKSAAALDHPFICQIHETGEMGGKAFIVMEYVEGLTLKEKMEAAKLPLRDALQIVLEVTEALEVAHSKGIVHRDIKPANIILTPQGHAKVMDFGLAKRFLPSGDELRQTLTRSITGEGAIAGTVAYMSPEQARGDIVDGRSDIFSLGIILDEMVSGVHPFSKPTPAETLTSVMRDPPPPVRVTPKSADASIAQILQRSLAKNPAQRYQKVTDLALDIRKLQSDLAAGGLIFRKWARIAGSVLLAAIVFIGLWQFVLRPREKALPAAPSPISVLVADFQNLTGDADFDGTLEQPMGISLEGAPYISVYKHPKAHSVANKLSSNADDRLDTERALLVSRREGINAVVEASIKPNGKGYTINVQALDSATGKKIAQADQIIKTKAEVLQATHDLAVKIGSKLGGIPPESVKALSKETFSTSSLEAMRAYSRGQELSNQGKDEEAIKEYEKALAGDPNMGRAYSGLATIYYNRGQFQEAEKFYQLAMANIDRMTEREKYRTSGVYYLIKQDYPKAIEQYSSLVKKFPADPAGRSNLAFAYFAARRMAEALEFGQKAVEANPGDVTARYNLGWYAMGAGNFEMAKNEELNVLKESPAYEKAYLVIGLSELALGRNAEAAEAYKKLEAVSSYGASVAAEAFADLAVYEGRLEDAIIILNKGIGTDLKSGLADYAADKLLILADVFLQKNQKVKAMECADKALTSSKNEDAMFAAGRIYLQAGADNKPKAIKEELSKKVQPINQAYAKLLEGEMSLRKGDATGAIRLFREAQSIVDTWLGRFFMGYASLEAGAFTEAYTEFDLCLKRRGEATSIFMNDLPSYRYFPQVYYYLGRAQEGLKSPAAKESYQTFLKIKEKSTGAPLVEDAKKRLAGLKTP